jgi:hypothetical protein
LYVFEIIKFILVVVVDRWKATWNVDLSRVPIEPNCKFFTIGFQWGTVIPIPANVTTDYILLKFKKPENENDLSFVHVETDDPQLEGTILVFKVPAKYGTGLYTLGLNSFNHL